MELFGRKGVIQASRPHCTILVLTLAVCGLLNIHSALQMRATLITWSRLNLAAELQDIYGSGSPIASDTTDSPKLFHSRLTTGAGHNIEQQCRSLVDCRVAEM